MRQLVLMMLAAALCLPGVARAANLQLLTEENPPGSFLKDGQPAGAGVEMILEMARRAGMETPIQFLPWARAYAMAQEEPEVGLFSTTRTPERDPLFQWVGPIIRVNWTLYAKAGSTIAINSLEDAKQYAIGTYLDDAREQFLKQQGFPKLDSVTNNTANVVKLLNDRIDLWVANSIGMPLLAADAGVQPQDLAPVFVIKTADLYLAFSKGTSQATVDAFAKALADMRADGTFAAIYKKWFPTEAPPQ